MANLICDFIMWMKIGEINFMTSYLKFSCGVSTVTNCTVGLLKNNYVQGKCISSGLRVKVVLYTHVQEARSNLFWNFYRFKTEQNIIKRYAILHENSCRIPFYSNDKIKYLESINHFFSL